ncbi:hypothetical protein ACFXPX_10345 [Kitasatospora sp. NPDC059146]
MVSCTTAEEPPPVVGSWKSSVASIEILEGGKLGEVSLLPAMCRGDSSSTAVKFTGTWKRGKLDDAGPGAVAELASVSGDLKCERFFQFVKRNGQDRLQMTGVDAGQESFVRQ